MSQPAVSLQVSEFEAILKTALFDRLPRGVRMTAAGELMLGYARRIDALEREAASAIAELLGLTRGRLVIGASLTIGSYLLPAILGVFRKQHPQVELVMEIANTQQIEQMLVENRLDLAFTEGLVHSAALAAETVFEDRLVLIAPANHPAVKAGRLTAAKVADDALILREAGSGTRDVIEAAFARRKLTLKPLMSLGSTEAIKRAVIAGVGLAIVSELTIENELAIKSLAVIPIDDLTIERPLQLLRPPGKSDSPAAKAFVGILQRTKGKHRPFKLRRESRMASS